MPRLRVNLPSANFQFTPTGLIIQEAYLDAIKLSHPDVQVLLGKEAGSYIEDGVVPANKTVKLIYGKAKSTFPLHLTPIYSDKILAHPVTFYSKDVMEISLIIQTLKSVPLAELGEALLIGLAT